jgi:hypothetical protein
MLLNRYSVLSFLTFVALLTSACDMEQGAPPEEEMALDRN